MNLQGIYALQIHGAFEFCPAKLESNSDIAPQNHRAVQILPFKIMETYFQGTKQKDKK